MLRDNNIFFDFNSSTKSFNELSTLFYFFVGFQFQSLIYFLFKDFIAYTICYFFSILFGFFSMYILLKRIFHITSMLSIVISIFYAILPLIPVWSIAVSTLPLIIYIFINLFINHNNTFSKKVFFIIFYPFFSSFSIVGFFILGLWFFGFIIFILKYKKINYNLLIGFFLLFIGYLLADFKLFFVMFILKTPLNRSIFSFDTNSLIIKVESFFHTFKSYFLNGHYHAASFQKFIIIPIAIILSLYYFIIIILKLNNHSGKLNLKIKTLFNGMPSIIKNLFIIEFIIISIYIITSLHDSGLLFGLINNYFPILNGFNWGRNWIINRVFWYVIFAICLQIIFEFDILKIKFFNVNIKTNNHFKYHYFVYLIIFTQLVYISLKPTYYNDQIKTWLYQLTINTNTKNRIFLNENIDDYISYREFFSKDFFEEIKSDISYSDELVVAFGYHPSVLMYNGFNCIDGYNNAYPLEYMQKFRTLIAPELAKNELAREYYDSWGGRMYLYSSELNYTPTRNKVTRPVNLNIDINIFRNDFNGKYILSRAEISNFEALGLKLVNRYYDENSIYTIYLYSS